MTAKKLTLCGPGCPGDGNFRVHRAGCADVARDARACGNDPWTIEAATRKDVVTTIYPPDSFEYDEADWENFDDLKVLPCVGKLPHA